MSAARNGAGVRAWGGQLALPTRLPAPAPAATFAAAGTAVALLGFAGGGYDATSWSWAAIGAACVAVVAVVAAGAVRSTLAEHALLALLVSFSVWTAVETARPGGATTGMPGVQRDVLYAAVVWAALLALRRATVQAALGGVLAGIVVVLGGGLVHLLLPAHVGADPYEGRLLSAPVGYANACGILAVVGILLALGLVARTSSGGVRIATSSSLVPLAVALALSGSRGAAAAAAVGVAVMLALDPSRHGTAAWLVVALPIPLVAAALAAGSHVTDVSAASTLVARDGRLVAAVVVALTLAQASCAALLLRPLAGSRALSRAAAGVGAALAGLVVAAAAGGAADSFGDRPLYWHAAWDDARAHPLLGSGPGSFAAEWLRRRTQGVAALNAHNLYLETLAELGPVGLSLLVAALVLPLVIAARRRSRETAVACGAYAAVLVHFAVDWDWQLPVVVVPALVCAACVLAAARREDASPPRARATLVCAAALALASCAAGIGEHAAAAAARADRAGAWSDAARLARTAETWQPWSAEPHRLAAEADLGLGDTAAARLELECAVRLDPGDWSTWYGLARVGDAAERSAAVARILRLNPLAVRAGATPAGSAPRARP